MTSYLTRLVQARASIRLIKHYITDGQFTKEKFVTCKPFTDEYKSRAAALKEFEAVAENLNFSGGDLEKLRKKCDPDFIKEVRQMYGMRSIIAHRYGVSTDIDYNQVWDTLNTRIGDVESVVEKLIEEEE